MLNQGECSISDYSVSKKLINLLLHGSLPREDDGAIEFWKLKDYLRNDFVRSQRGSDEMRKSTMAKGGGKQEKISIWYWFFRRNSVPPSSPRSVRTQSYWSFITGQCRHSGRFLPIHMSCRMCNQFAFHHQTRIDTGRSKFEQQTDSILSACGSHGQKPWGSWQESTWKHRVVHNTCTKHGRNIKIRCIGSTSTLLRKKDWSSIRRYRTPSFFLKRSQLIVSRKLFGWTLEKSKTRKYVAVISSSSKDFLETWLDERIGFRSCSTTRGRSCSTIQKFSIKPTKSNPRSW